MEARFARLASIRRFKLTPSPRINPAKETQTKGTFCCRMLTQFLSHSFSQCLNLMSALLTRAHLTNIPSAYALGFIGECSFEHFFFSVSLFSLISYFALFFSFKTFFNSSPHSLATIRKSYSPHFTLSCFIRCTSLHFPLPHITSQKLTKHYVMSPHFTLIHYIELVSVYLTSHSPMVPLLLFLFLPNCFFSSCTFGCHIIPQ